MKPLKMLLIEDNPTDYFLLQKSLTQAKKKLDVVHVESLKEAIDCLKKRDFDIVLSDLFLPDSNGLDTVKKMYTVAPDVPIVVLTGLDNEDIAIAALREGTQDYLFKGEIYQSNLLIRAIHYAIERHNLSEKLRQSETRYRGVVEDQTALICRFLPDGTLTFANQVFCSFLGKLKENLRGLNFLEIFAEADRERVRSYLATLTWENQVGKMENAFVVPKGKMRWYQWTNRAIFDQMRNLVEFQSIGWDITEQIQADTALRLEQIKTEQLLLNILPAPIAQKLKQEEEDTIAEEFEEVTVMFADIVGFTQFATRTAPKNLVEILNHIFSKFDDLTEHYGLEKIKTIGDAYMVAGGLPLAKKNHAEAIAKMALDMQGAINNFTFQCADALTLRIGIHTGSVVAGVIGKQKFSYDLWGDTVNIASRMESHGVPGQIQVSEVTYERLQEQFLFEKRGSIQVKGKGKMMTYFLKGKSRIGNG